MLILLIAVRRILRGFFHTILNQLGVVRADRVEHEIQDFAWRPLVGVGAAPLGLRRHRKSELPIVASIPPGERAAARSSHSIGKSGGEKWLQRPSARVGRREKGGASTNKEGALGWGHSVFLVKIILIHLLKLDGPVQSHSHAVFDH